MNIYSKQLTEIATSRFDITTSLGFFGQIKDKLTPESTLTGSMGPVWTAFTAAYSAFDTAYSQARRWQQTADLEELDKQRDAALSAYLQALKAMTLSPNQTKQTAAKLLQFIRDKYSLNSADEYMKETTAISQMVQEMEASTEAQTALTTTGLDDWYVDLKQKNEAFLAKMNERTEAQAGQQKGIVREKRLLCEAAYRNVVKLINAMAICEVPAGYAFGGIIDLLNAEIEHYRQILAWKGVSTGTNSGGSDDSGSGDSGSGTGTGDGGGSGTGTGDGEGSGTGTGDGGGSGTGTGDGGGSGTGTGDGGGSGSGGGSSDEPEDGAQ